MSAAKWDSSVLFPWPLRHFWWLEMGEETMMVQHQPSSHNGKFHTIITSKQTMPANPLVQTVTTWLHNSSPKQALANGNPDESKA